MDESYLRRYTHATGDQRIAAQIRAAPEQMNLHSLDLSIIIPAFNEERRLPKAIESVGMYLKGHSFRSEMIVVDDGSTDATARLAASYQDKYSNLRVLSNGRNRGKGFSVRHGMLEARGEIALFTDADLSTPIEETDKLIATLREQRFDGAIGSRALDRNLIETHQSVVREQAGILFNHFVRWIMGIAFSDTQCGFKAFRMNRARILFEQQRMDGFSFDAEILFLAKRHGLRVAEVPVRWLHDPATKVNVAADGARMLLDLFVIREHARRGFYPRITK